MVFSARHTKSTLFEPRCVPVVDREDAEHDARDRAEDDDPDHRGHGRVEVRLVEDVEVI
jgi:hypothetical protein